MSFLCSKKYASLALVGLLAMGSSIDAFAPQKVSRAAFVTASPVKASSTLLFGKKSARKSTGGGGPGKKGAGQVPQEKQSVKDARFDAATRQFMFTMVGLTKTLPDKSKQILKGIDLCFYPGAKIGVVGLNGSGKSTMLKIMAGTCVVSHFYALALFHWLAKKILNPDSTAYTTNLIHIYSTKLNAHTTHRSRH